MEGMKPRFKSTIWNLRKKKAFNQENKKKKVKKQNRIGSFWDISKCTI